ncbi:MAG: class I SAM-dependent methyltransferase [Acidimicrobiales bacterium]
MSIETAPGESADRPRHWDDVHDRRATDELTWFQPRAATSLELIATAGTDTDAAVIDVGGGASVLVDDLLDAGFGDVTVLDVSESALAATRRRLGPAADTVESIATDLFDWSPTRHYSLWHDRAVFHFLVEKDQRVRYVEILRESLAPDGHVVMATFAADGPLTCSGLPVCRYSPAELTTELGSGFETVTTRREEHVTPTGAIQPFTWVLARRQPDTGR